MVLRDYILLFFNRRQKLNFQSFEMDAVNPNGQVKYLDSVMNKMISLA